MRREEFEGLADSIAQLSDRSLAALRSQTLSFEKTCSMGEKSGL